MMIMMIAPKSLIHKKEGYQGEEKEEAGDRRKGGQIRTPTPGADARTGPYRSGVPDARNRRKHGQWCGLLLHRTGKGG